MHQRTNCMKFSEILWTCALDLKIQVKQTKEKIPCLVDYFQAVDTEWNKSIYIWEFAWADRNHWKIINTTVLISYAATPATHRASFVKEQEEEAIKTITKNNDKLSSLMKKSWHLRWGIKFNPTFRIPSWTLKCLHLARDQSNPIRQ